MLETQTGRGKKKAPQKMHVFSMSGHSPGKNAPRTRTSGHRRGRAHKIKKTEAVVLAGKETAQYHRSNLTRTRKIEDRISEGAAEKHGGRCCLYSKKQRANSLAHRTGTRRSNGHCHIPVRLRGT